MRRSSGSVRRRASLTLIRDRAPRYLKPECGTHRPWEEAMLTSTFTLTDEERELLPSDDDVSSYATHGWYMSKKLLTDDEVDTLLTASERFYAGERDRNLPQRPPNLAYWKPSHGAVQRHNDYIHYESDKIGRILRKPLIGAVAARLAGATEIRIFQATLIYKPPVRNEPTNLVPWHADRHYWQTCTSERMLTAFIPFHHCDEEMGTITMVDGSHLWKEPPGGDDSTRHFAQRDRDELEALLEKNAEFNGAQVAKIPMVISKGHMSFHHCRTYHGVLFRCICKTAETSGVVTPGSMAARSSTTTTSLSARQPLARRIMPTLHSAR